MDQKSIIIILHITSNHPLLEQLQYKTRSKIEMFNNFIININDY